MPLGMFCIPCGAWYCGIDGRFWYGGIPAGAVIPITVLPGDMFWAASPLIGSLTFIALGVPTACPDPIIGLPCGGNACPGNPCAGNACAGNGYCAFCANCGGIPCDGEPCI